MSRYVEYDLVTILAGGGEPYAFQLDNVVCDDARVAQRLHDLKIRWAPCDVSDGVYSGHIDGYVITATKIVLVCVLMRVATTQTARTMSLVLAARIVRDAFPGYDVRALAVCRGPMEVVVSRVDLNEAQAAEDFLRRHSNVSHN